MTPALVLENNVQLVTVRFAPAPKRTAQPYHCPVSGTAEANTPLQ